MIIRRNIRRKLSMKKFEYIESVQSELAIWNNKHKQNERMTMQMLLDHLGSFGWDIFP